MKKTSTVSSLSVHSEKSHGPRRSLSFSLEKRKQLSTASIAVKKLKRENTDLPPDFIEDIIAPISLNFFDFLNFDELTQFAILNKKALSLVKNYLTLEPFNTPIHLSLINNIVMGADFFQGDPERGRILLKAICALWQLNQEGIHQALVEQFTRGRSNEPIDAMTILKHCVVLQNTAQSKLTLHKPNGMLLNTLYLNTGQYKLPDKTQGFFSKHPHSNQPRTPLALLRKNSTHFICLYVNKHNRWILSTFNDQGVEVTWCIYKTAPPPSSAPTLMRLNATEILIQENSQFIQRFSFHTQKTEKFYHSLDPIHHLEVADPNTVLCINVNDTLTVLDAAGKMVWEIKNCKKACGLTNGAFVYLNDHNELLLADSAKKTIHTLSNTTVEVDALVYLGLGRIFLAPTQKHLEENTPSSIINLLSRPQ